jgi:hypothetical protein
MVALYNAVYARHQAMRRRKGKREMKHMRIVGLMVVILTAARVAGAQVLNIDVGVPLRGPWNDFENAKIIDEGGIEDQVAPIGDPASLFFPTDITTTFPGDLILTNSNNPAGGNAPSNWLADIRFFNPLDPTGALGLPATETEAFFPADLGPGGFASFQLMPDYNYVQGDYSAVFAGVTGVEVVFGPIGGFVSDQEGIIKFHALPGAQAASTPEPGGMALLFGVGIVGAGLLVRRRRKKTEPSAFLRTGNPRPLVTTD